MPNKVLKIDILSIFPDFFGQPLGLGIPGRATEKGLATLHFHDLRQWTHSKRRNVDDVPYGGGPGMVMRPEPLVEALEGVSEAGKKVRRIYFSPKGKRLEQAILPSYLSFDQLILLCGRYEGIDQRVIDHYIDEELSIGDYIVSGGESAALVFVDALLRLIPGVLGSSVSLKEETFAEGLEYPHYTRPEDFRGHCVPEVLLSGHHERIDQWRKKESQRLTQLRRPDLNKL